MNRNKKRTYIKFEVNRTGRGDIKIRMFEKTFAGINDWATVVDIDQATVIRWPWSDKLSMLKRTRKKIDGMLNNYRKNIQEITHINAACWEFSREEYDKKTLQGLK